MKFLFNKLLAFSLLLIGLGVAFLILENIYYGNDIGPDGVLQESMFLPLGFLSCILGGFLFSVSMIGKVWSRFTQNK